MTDSTKRPPRRPKKGRRTASIGGTSQSAFAGYAPKIGQKRPKKKAPPETEPPNADDNDNDNEGDG